MSEPKAGDSWFDATSNRNVVLLRIACDDRHPEYKYWECLCVEEKSKIQIFHYSMPLVNSWYIAPGIHDGVGVQSVNIW